MLKVKDRKQQHLFDPWYFLSPKRRKMLDTQWPGFFRKHILIKMPVDTLAMAFPSDQGRPTKELYTVLGALILQQYHDLTDKQVVEQLAFNIQWHYALDISEESDEAKYICEKTLWSMRLDAATLGIDIEILDLIATELADLFKVDTSKQHLDSVHIKSNMARLGRIGIIVRAIDRFLVNLKRHHLKLWKKIDTDLVERYQGQQAAGCFAAVKPSESKKTLIEVASDLYRLVTLFKDSAPVTGMNTYKTLCRIVREQCDIQSDGTIELKAPKQISSDSLQNPSDLDATYSGHKGQGYQVQVMETFTEHEESKKDPAELNLITHVDVETACQSDAQALIPAIEATLENDLAPVELQADSLYGSDENCQQAKLYGVEVVSPTMGTENKSGTKLSDFEFREDGHVHQCPAGHEPLFRRKNKGRYSQGFDKDICCKCPRQNECPTKQGKRYFYLHYEKKAMRLAKRRQHENTAQFKERYRWRAGVEATMSQYDRLTGVKHLRVRGFKAVRFAATLKAAAVNIARAVAALRAKRRPEGPDTGPSGGNRGAFGLFKELFARIVRAFFGWIPENLSIWVISQIHV
ncbi:MAG: transposase [Desulfosarcinaceae bacterium]